MMLTSAEKHFIQSWKDQREGPRWKYYLQYIIAWSTVTFLSLFFLTKLISSNRDMGGWLSFYIILVISILLGVIATHFTYTSNEKKLKKILKREEQINDIK
jgi:pilus assembly protein TadC